MTLSDTERRVRSHKLGLVARSYRTHLMRRGNGFEWRLLDSFGGMGGSGRAFKRKDALAAAQAKRAEIKRDADAREAA